MAHYGEIVFNPMSGMTEIQKKHTYEQYGHILEVTREQKHRLELEENMLKKQQTHYLHDMKREKTILEKELKDIRAKTRPFHDTTPQDSNSNSTWHADIHPGTPRNSAGGRLHVRRRSEHDILHGDTGSEREFYALKKHNNHLHGSNPSLTAFSVHSNCRPETKNLSGQSSKNPFQRSSSPSAGPPPQSKYWFDPFYGIQPRTMYRIKKANMVTSTLDHHHAMSYQYRQRPEAAGCIGHGRSRSFTWGSSSPSPETRRRILPTISRSKSDLTSFDVHAVHK